MTACSTDDVLRPTVDVGQQTGADCACRQSARCRVTKPRSEVDRCPDARRRSRRPTSLPNRALTMNWSAPPESERRIVDRQPTNRRASTRRPRSRPCNHHPNRPRKSRSRFRWLHCHGPASRRCRRPSLTKAHIPGWNCPRRPGRAPCPPTKPTAGASSRSSASDIRISLRSATAAPASSTIRSRSARWAAFR